MTTTSSSREILDGIAHLFMVFDNSVEGFLEKTFVDPPTEPMYQQLISNTTTSSYSNINLCGGSLNSNREKVATIMHALRSSNRIIDPSFTMNVVMGIIANHNSVNGIPAEIVSKLLTPSTYDSQRPPCRWCSTQKTSTGTPLGRIVNRNPNIMMTQQQACPCRCAMNTLHSVINNHRLNNIGHINNMGLILRDLSSWLETGSMSLQPHSVKSIHEKIRETLNQSLLHVIFDGEGSIKPANNKIIVSPAFCIIEDQVVPSEVQRNNETSQKHSIFFSATGGSMAFLDNILEDLFVPLMKVQQDSQDYGKVNSVDTTISISHFLRDSEKLAICYGYMARPKNSINLANTWVTSLEAELQSLDGNQEKKDTNIKRKACLEEAISNFEEMAILQGENDCNSCFINKSHAQSPATSSKAFHDLVINMNKNIRSINKKLLDIIESDHNHNIDSHINNHHDATINTFMNLLDELLMVFIKREVLWLRNLIKIMGNLDIVSVSDDGKPILIFQPLRLFRFIFLKKTWPIFQILNPQYPLDNVLTLLDFIQCCHQQKNVNTTACHIKQDIKTQVSSLICNSTKSEVNKANCRLTVVQRLNTLFCTISQDFNTQTMSAICLLHDANDMFYQKLNLL